MLLFFHFGSDLQRLKAASYQTKAKLHLSLYACWESKKNMATVEGTAYVVEKSPTSFVVTTPRQHYFLTMTAIVSSSSSLCCSGLSQRCCCCPPSSTTRPAIMVRWQGEDRTTMQKCYTFPICCWSFSWPKSDWVLFQLDDRKFFIHHVSNCMDLSILVLFVQVNIISRFQEPNLRNLICYPEYLEWMDRVARLNPDSDSSDSTCADAASAKRHTRKTDIVGGTRVLS